MRRMGVIAMGRENRRKTRRPFTRRRHRGVATAFADSFQSAYRPFTIIPGIAAEARDGARSNRWRAHRARCGLDLRVRPIAVLWRNWQTGTEERRYVSCID